MTDTILLAILIAICFWGYAINDGQGRKAEGSPSGLGGLLTVAIVATLTALALAALILWLPPVIYSFATEYD